MATFSVTNTRFAYEGTMGRNLPLDVKDTLKLAIASYGFLVPEGETQNATEFAKTIAKHYDILEPVNKEVMDALKFAANLET